MDLKCQYGRTLRSYADYDVFGAAGLLWNWQAPDGWVVPYGSIGASGWFGGFNITQGTTPDSPHYTPSLDLPFLFYGGTLQSTLALGIPIARDRWMIAAGLLGSVSLESGNYAVFRQQTAVQDGIVNLSPSPWSGNFGINLEGTHFNRNFAVRFGIAEIWELTDLLQLPNYQFRRFIGKVYGLFRTDDLSIGLAVQFMAYQNWGIALEFGTKLL